MAKELKNLIVKEYLSSFKDIKNFVIVSYRGVNSLESDELRAKLRKSGIVFRVVKNSLIVLAFKELGIQELNDYINGPCAIATNKDDGIELVKSIVGCKKDVKSLEINGGYIDGRQVPSEEISELAKLPDRNVLNAQILAGISSPMVGFVNVFNCVLRNLLVCLKEIKEKKG